MFQLAYQRGLSNAALIPVLREARDESLNIYLQMWLDPVAQTETREGSFLVVAATDEGAITLRPWLGIDAPTGNGDDFTVNTAAISYMQIG